MAFGCCACPRSLLWLVSPSNLNLSQAVASSDKDHLQNVMAKIKVSKAKERADLDRNLRVNDGGIEGMDGWKNGKRPKGERERKRRK